MIRTQTASAGLCTARVYHLHGEESSIRDCNYRGRAESLLASYELG